NIDDSTISKNSAGNEGGGIEADAEGVFLSLNVSRSLFEKNKGSSKSGGALDVESRGGVLSVSLNRVAFNKNTAGSEGGGAIQGGAPGGILEMQVTNSVFLKNKSVGPGGALEVRSPDLGFGGNLDVVNSTFVGNASSNEGGGIFVSAGNGPPLQASLINSIARGNRGTDGADVHVEGPGLDAYGGYSNVASGRGPYTDLGGNVNVDPMFVDAAHG